MKFQILKIVALLNAAAVASATTAAGAPPVKNLNRAHGTNIGTTVLESAVVWIWLKELNFCLWYI